MEISGLDQVKSSAAGRLVPVYGERPLDHDALEYFKKISDYGRSEHSILLESTDIISKYGEKSIGSAHPCLNIRGRGATFTIRALNDLGERFLHHLEPDLTFCDDLTVEPDRISGQLEPDHSIQNEEERLKAVTHADLLRSIAFKLTPLSKPFTVYGGLFGMIGYDFVDQFEKLDGDQEDLLNEPDYELNFYDNLFLIDHKTERMVFISCALIFEGTDRTREIERCRAVLNRYKSALSNDLPDSRSFPDRNGEITSDTSREEFIDIVSSLKDHVLKGDVFQVVPSRTFIKPYSSEPLDIYSALRDLNPSPYMFYTNHSSGMLLGSSPETCLKVEGDHQKKVEIRPIAGTKQRGIVDGEVDPDLDSRYETALKTDRKELAEHTMLIDLARNDVARVCKPGTRYCDKPFSIEKYSHVQHIASNVSGILREDLDALHAYLASMNMGTLTGAPKVRAMKLLRQYEKTRRGFYGGAIGYLTPSGDFDSAIVIRSMSLKNDRAHVRAGAGVVYDSIPEKEFEETRNKAHAALQAIDIADER